MSTFFIFVLQAPRLRGFLFHALGQVSLVGTTPLLGGGTSFGALTVLAAAQDVAGFLLSFVRLAVGESVGGDGVAAASAPPPWGRLAGEGRLQNCFFASLCVSPSSASFALKTST